jgi:hypothetical protein
MDSNIVREDIVRAEYRRLCALLGLPEVTLDVYEYLEGAPPSQMTPLGTPLCRFDPGYSSTRKLLALPQVVDDLPDNLPEFPPTDWRKLIWPPWRIELWHEVIHQLSDHLGVLDIQEPGRVRFDETQSSKGHGEGWRIAIQRAAERFGLPPDELDSLLDR